MVVTGLEQGLLSVVVFLVGGIAGKVIFPGVSRRDCTNTSKSLHLLVNTRLDGLDQRLQRIETKIDDNAKR